MMDFDPAFPLLGKFTVGLPSTPASEDDVRAASAYLGVDVPEGALDQSIAFLSEELSRQNRFLTIQLESDSIFESDDYRRSKFIREIVTNNRINRQNRLNRRR